jgi:lipid II:glycine glycyltransferase (peptidoglycan interpeptide bridge formation enzyme)
MTHGEIPETFAADFVRRFEAYCQRQSIVAEFGHLHPWNCRIDCLHVENVVPEREIVYVDLTLTEEQLWHDSFSYACRKNIRRAQNEQVRVFLATQAGDVREFHRIYLQTMQRNQALDKYYFPLDYFLAFFEQMPDRARFALAEQRGQIIAATLYLHDDQDVYSYLGGADQTFQQSRPTNAVVFDTIQWARRSGKRRLILGGGYTPDDGIFRFKSNFSPLRGRFKVYRHIHLPDRFAELCTAWAKHYNCPIPAAGYFPIYRALPKPVTEMIES